MSSSPLIVFAGGGTGGHLFPALAIIEWMRDHHRDARLEFLCTQRPIDQQILNKWDIPFTVQKVEPLRFAAGAALRFYRAWRRSLKLCIDRFKHDRPAVVVGTGGFGSGPAVKAASRLGVPTALLNPDAIPGRANRYLARTVDVIFAQWQETSKHFPASANVITAGCPVRRDFYQPKTGDEYALFDLDPTLKTLLITGASSGARTINEASVRLAHDLAQVIDWQILHISGGDDAARVQDAYSQAGLTARVLSFTDEMSAALRCADLAVARAGAVTLAELTVTATPAILMPYPFHKDNHQTANAEMLVRLGTAITLVDMKETSRNIAQLRAALLPMMKNPEELSKLSAAAQKHSAANPAELISQHLLRLGGLAAG